MREGGEVGMRITDEMIAEDEKRWHARDILMELGYCSTYMRDRKDITNLDIRFYAYIMRKARDLLKVQEPRVITWQEVIGAAIECKPVYIEVKDNEDKESGDDRWAMVTQYKDSITNGMIRAMSSYITSEILFAEEYGVKWRCWTSRPTDEQRETEPWE